MNIHLKKENMIRNHLEARGITDPGVLSAMREVPREAFVERDQVPFAYDDGPLPIGEGQVITQPYVVAVMIDALSLSREDIVLDVGTGSGYAAAVMSRLCRHVYCVERHPSLVDAARERIRSLGYDNLTLTEGDGSQGWPEHAPFDAIHVAAASDDVPAALVAQLADDGRLVMPLGSPESPMQRLVCFKHTQGGNLTSEELDTVRFVPLVSGH